MATKTRPRKKVTTVTEEIPEGTPLEGEELAATEFDVSLEQADDLETLNRVLEQYGIQDGILFRIYKIVDGVQRFSFEHPVLDEAYIQQQRGGGNYVARLFINGKWKRNIPVPIDDAPESKRVDNNGGGHQAFLEKMLMALILKENQPSANTPSITDLTTALANLDGLRGKQESAMETFIKGMEMADRFGGGRGDGKLDWKKELFDIAKDNAPAALHAINSGLALRNGGTPPPPPNPAPVPQPQPTPEQMEQEMSFALRIAIGQVKSQFMQGLDPDSALNFIIANIGNVNYAPVIQRFAMMSFEELIALDADIGKEPFQSKFRVVHDGLRSYLAGDDFVGDDPAGDGGDVTDVGRNGNPRKTRG